MLRVFEVVKQASNDFVLVETIATTSYEHMSRDEPLPTEMRRLSEESQRIC